MSPHTPYAQLLSAIKSQDVVGLLALLREGASPNTVGPHGDAVLFDAAVAGDVRVGKALIEAGALLEARSAFTGATPMLEAARFGSVDFVCLLLDSGANPLAVDADGHNAHTLARFNLHDDAARVCQDRGIPLQPEFDAQADETRRAIAAAQ